MDNRPKKIIPSASSNPLSHLGKFPKDLTFLLVTDFKLFDHDHESWQHYDAREPNSVNDLLNTLADMVLPAVSNKPRFKLTLDYIIKLHDSACFSNKNIVKGLRTTANTFPVTKETVTKQGLSELIEKTNHPDYSSYKIGKYYYFGIFKLFSTSMKKLAWDASVSNFKNDFPKLANKAIDEVVQILTKENYKISKDDVIKIINNGIESLKHARLKSDPNFKFDDLLFLRYNLTSVTEGFHSCASQFEFNFYLNYSKQRALNAGNCTQADLDEISNLFEKLQSNQEIQIHLFPPEIKNATALAENLINEFNDRMSGDDLTEIEVINSIDTLINGLEILHLFSDGNLRTLYLLLNQLLMTYGLTYCVLYDPNRLDGYSKNERIAEIKEGIARFRTIVHDSKSLCKKNILNQKPFTDSIRASTDDGFAMIAKNRIIEENKELANQYNRTAEHFTTALGQFIDPAISKTIESESETGLLSKNLSQTVLAEGIISSRKGSPPPPLPAKRLPFIFHTDDIISKSGSVTKVPLICDDNFENWFTSSNSKSIHNLFLYMPDKNTMYINFGPNTQGIQIQRKGKKSYIAKNNLTSDNTDNPEEAKKRLKDMLNLIQKELNFDLAKNRSSYKP